MSIKYTYNIIYTYSMVYWKLRESNKFCYNIKIIINSKDTYPNGTTYSAAAADQYEDRRPLMRIHLLIFKKRVLNDGDKNASKTEYNNIL